jgi:hypothetical protein
VKTTRPELLAGLLGLLILLAVLATSPGPDHSAAWWSHSVRRPNTENIALPR